MIRSLNSSRLSDRAGLATTTRQPQSVFREQAVPEIQELCDHRQSRKPYCRGEADSSIKASKHLDAVYPRSIWQSTVHFSHKFVLRFAEGRCVKSRRCNVGKQDSLVAIHLPQQPSFPHAQWTVAVVEHFNCVIRFHL